MNLNSDFSVRAAVHAARMDWTASPQAGVERRMLDRVGGEVARATTIVHYAPGSRFSAHVHEGGEEFLVLNGMFQDEHGDYPAGFYVRNPPGSRHMPGSAPGCTIFVKLRQFAPEDRTALRLDTRQAGFAPVPGRPGVSQAALFQTAREQVRLERWAPGAVIDLALPGGLQVLVLEGAFQETGETFEPQSWLRLPAGARLQANAGESGCLLWIKSGHLKPSAT